MLYGLQLQGIIKITRERVLIFYLETSNQLAYTIKAMSTSITKVPKNLNFWVDHTCQCDTIMVKNHLKIWSIFKKHSPFYRHYLMVLFLRQP